MPFSLRDRLSRALMRTKDRAIGVLGSRDGMQYSSSMLIDQNEDTDRPASPASSILTVFNPFSSETISMSIDERFQRVMLKLATFIVTLKAGAILTDTIISKINDIRTELAHLHLTTCSEFARKQGLIDALEAMQQLVSRLRREREDELKEETRRVRDSLRNERMEVGQLNQRLYERDSTIRRLNRDDKTSQATIQKLTGTIEQMREAEKMRKLMEGNN